MRIEHSTTEAGAGPAEELAARILAPDRGALGPRLRRLFERFPLAALSRFDRRRLQTEGQLATRQAELLWAAFALGRSVEASGSNAGHPLRSAERVFAMMAPELRGREQESFHVLALDSKHRLKGRTRISEGTLTASLVHPREVFRPAVRLSAAAVIVVHNHPSGDPEPSAEDVAVTRRLIDGGRLLGIPLLDHVILGASSWVSLRDRIPFGGGRADVAAADLPERYE